MGVLSKLGESWGAKADVWWPTAVSALGSVAALTGPYFGQTSTHPNAFVIGLVVGILGVLAASLSPVYETFRHKAAVTEYEGQIDQLKQDAKDRETEAEIRERENYLLLVHWTLVPLAKKLAEVLQCQRNSRRLESLSAELKTQILNTAKELVGSDPNRVRANYFALEFVDPESAVLRAAGSTSHPPRDQFIEDSAEGRAVFDMLAQDGHLYCHDVKETPPEGWDESKERNYRTFISVTVKCDVEPVGMLTVDAKYPGDLDEGDVPILRLLGVILAISESQKRT